MFLHTENSSQQAGNDVIQAEAVHCCLVVYIHMSCDNFGFLQGLTHTDLYSHKSRLEA